jgi:hypothetical protein
MSESRYAFSLTTFSPSGKLGQIEHALAAVHKGKTCLGIQGAYSRGKSGFDSLRANTYAASFVGFSAATDGVVVATEKKVPSILVDEESFQRTAMLSDNIGPKTPLSRSLSVLRDCDRSPALFSRYLQASFTRVWALTSVFLSAKARRKPSSTS